MKIRYFFNFPAIIDGGGAGKVIQNMTKMLSQKHECLPLDFTSKSLDFDVLMVFDLTYLNPMILSWYKKNGIKVVIYPIFDRTKPLWKMKLLKPLMMRFPVLNTFSQRKQVLECADLIITGNESESRDVIELYDADKSIVKMMHYGLDDAIFEMEKTVSKDLFKDKYGITDFVFCPASDINKRKNQLNLIKAVKGTSIKLVLNNTHIVRDYEKREFDELVENEPNILCLERLDYDMLISCYKNAKVSVSVSHAETAGLVNLEAGYFGCNLVVSELESFREYLGDFAMYVDQNNVLDIQEKLQLALEKQYDPKFKEYISLNHRWGGYIDLLVSHINKIVK